MSSFVGNGLMNGPLPPAPEKEVLRLYRRATHTHRAHLRVLGDNFFQGPDLKPLPQFEFGIILFINGKFVLSRLLWKISVPGRNIFFEGPAHPVVTFLC